MAAQDATIEVATSNAAKIKPAEMRELTPIQRRMVLIIEQVNGAASARELLQKFLYYKEKQGCSR